MFLSLTLSLSLTLTRPAHHTSSTYLTPPTVPRMFVKDVPAVFVKYALPQFLASSITVYDI